MFYLDKLIFDLFVKVGAVFGVGAFGGAIAVLLFFMYAYVLAIGGKRKWLLKEF